MTEQFIPRAPVATWPGDTGLKNIHSFAVEGATPEDIELILGPFRPGETVTIVPEIWTLAHIMHAVGAFPSVKQAKSNGWNRPIPDGFSEFGVGKNKIPICVLGRPVVAIS